MKNKKGLLLEAIENGNFEVRLSAIQHLDQIEILTGAVSVLNELLIEKGVVTTEEIQDRFLNWMKIHDLLRSRISGD